MVALTAFAIWQRSWGIASISSRWYFITGVWPVANVCDYAPAESDADRQRAVLGGLVLGARVAGHVEPRDAESAARSREVP